MKSLTLLLLCMATLLTGCASVRTPAPVSTATTLAHINRGGEYVDSALTATKAAKARVDKIKVSADSAQANAAKLAVPGGDEADRTRMAQEVVVDIKDIQDATAEATVQLSEANTKLEQEKAERVSAQAALAEVQTKADSLAAQEQKAVERAQAAEASTLKEKAAAHENAKERDVVILAFAFLFGLWVIAHTGKLVSDACPQYAVLIQGAIFTAAVAAGYGFGRFVLLTLAKFIP